MSEPTYDDWQMNLPPEGLKMTVVKPDPMEHWGGYYSDRAEGVHPPYGGYYLSSIWMKQKWAVCHLDVPFTTFPSWEGAVDMAIRLNRDLGYKKYRVRKL